MTREELATHLDKIVPMLADRFPVDVFCDATLEAVAAQACHGWPGYGEIVEGLNAWWRGRKPFTPEPRAERTPDRIPPTDEECAYVDRVIADWKAGLPLPPDPRPPPGPRHATPQQLDILNPLPNGLKRYAAPDEHPPPTDAPPVPGEADADGWSYPVSPAP